MTRKLLLSLAVALTLPVFTTACVAADKAASPVLEKAQWPFAATEVARFDEPWAMSFLPDGSLLVSEKSGALQHLDPKTGKAAAISGVPDVAYGGQGGFGDILPHPGFARNQWVYLSYAEAGTGATSGAAVARAR
ncbi:MAG TPA: glucose dehydrogenase, partial [Stenotrophomonas sp.]|nr:glucose dehydrogenase [Stenotrophomonas sp.]